MAKILAQSFSIPNVIFGASGDLTHCKLVPELFSLCRNDRQLASGNIVGFAFFYEIRSIN